MIAAYPDWGREMEAIMSRITTRAHSVKDRLMTIALWTGLLAAAWSLPVLDRIQAQAERERMESGFYYTSHRPAEAYAAVALEDQAR
jgi:hypothetical protein